MRPFNEGGQLYNKGFPFSQYSAIKNITNRLESWQPSLNYCSLIPGRNALSIFQAKIHLGKMPFDKNQHKIS